MTTTDPTKPHICTPNCEPGCAQPAAADPTGRPPRVDGADLVIRDLRQQLVAARQDTARVRSQLAEARQERDQATEALIQAETERDEAWDRLSNLVDELAGALEMSGTPDDHEIIREARTFGQLRVELSALRAEREWLADRARQMGIAEELRTLTAGSAPDTGSTHG